ncbi:MAG: spoIIIAF [Anaerosolibacter sp.]|uniref:stage III sporulation protein AF n=1 Tax=Anaerosolibacter sp. TaxID=1872527 RepID=UPI00260E19C1|nr:stage III sporulation protein AF [Anaerosolibacter sp.]MDF2546472.1 spoIIIAF [Anaerosolibacter sp.]
MTAFLRTWTLNIVMVVIFISFVELLLPSSSMKKYIKMVVGLLVILVILNPIIELLYGDINVQDEIFKSTVMIEREALSKDAAGFQKSRNQQMIAMYKEKISEHLRDKIGYEYDVRLENARIEIEEDTENKDFGKIKEIHLVLTEGNKMSEEQIAIENIDQVSIAVNGGPSKTPSNKPEDLYIISDIKNSISRFYDIEEDNINISMNKTSH